MTQLQQLLGVVNLWVQQLRGVRPSAVQVSANEVASVVAIDDTVWVEHGDDLKDELVSEHLGLLVVILKQKVNGSLDHETCVGLTRVHAACQEYCLLGVRIDLLLVLGSHLEPRKNRVLVFCVGQRQRNGVWIGLVCRF